MSFGGRVCVSTIRGGWMPVREGGIREVDALDDDDRYCRSAVEPFVSLASSLRRRRMAFLLGCDLHHHLLPSWEN